MKNDVDGYSKIWRTFDITERPVKWVVWPYSTSEGWKEKIEGKI